MKTKITYFLLALATAVIFAAGAYFFVWDSYCVGDMDAAGAYVGLFSMLSFIIPLSVKNIAFIKNVALGIGITTIALLFLLWYKTNFSLTYEGLHIFIMMLAMPVVHIGLYFSLKRKLKKNRKQAIHSNFYYVSSLY